MNYNNLINIIADKSFDIDEFNYYAKDLLENNSYHSQFNRLFTSINDYDVIMNKLHDFTDKPMEYIRHCYFIKNLKEMPDNISQIIDEEMKTAQADSGIIRKHFYVGIKLNKYILETDLLKDISPESKYIYLYNLIKENDIGALQVWNYEEVYGMNKQILHGAVHPCAYFTNGNYDDYNDFWKIKSVVLEKIFNNNKYYYELNFHIDYAKTKDFPLYNDYNVIENHAKYFIGKEDLIAKNIMENFHIMILLSCDCDVIKSLVENKLLNIEKYLDPKILFTLFVENENTIGYLANLFMINRKEETIKAMVSGGSSFEIHSAYNERHLKKNIIAACFVLDNIECEEFYNILKKNRLVNILTDVIFNLLEITTYIKYDNDKIHLIKTFLNKLSYKIGNKIKITFSSLTDPLFIALIDLKLFNFRFNYGDSCSDNPDMIIKDIIENKLDKKILIKYCDFLMKKY